jgi:hypothetical protein
VQGFVFGRHLTQSQIAELANVVYPSRRPAARVAQAI